jgi:hypothetical protein
MKIRLKAAHFSHTLRTPDALTLNGRNIHFISHAKYACVNFDKIKVRWSLAIMAWRVLRLGMKETASRYGW